MKIYYKKCFLFLIILGSIYQFADLTIDYLNYKYLVETSVKQVFGPIPSVTICLNEPSKIEIFEDIKLNTKRKRVMLLQYYISCYVKLSTGKNEPCYSYLTKVRYKEKGVCLTYFAEQDEYFMNDNNTDNNVPFIMTYESITSKFESVYRVEF